MPSISKRGGGHKNSTYVFHQGLMTSKEIKSSLPFVDLCLKLHDCSRGFALNLSLENLSLFIPS